MIEQEQGEAKGQMSQTRPLRPKSDREKDTTPKRKKAGDTEARIRCRVKNEEKTSYIQFIKTLKILKTSSSL